MFSDIIFLKDDSKDEDDDSLEEDEDDQEHEQEIHEVLTELERTGVLQMDDALGYSLKPEAVPSICALYFDQVLRYDGNRHDLLELPLKQLSAVG